MWLKQSTASQHVLLGPFLDDTDGNTAKTALTINNTDIKLWKGGTSEVNKNSGGATHIAAGRYYAILNSTDTNTLGPLEINVHVSGALPIRREFMVVPANVYDAIIAGSSKLQVNAVELSGTAQTARDIGASVLLSAGTGTGQISLSSGAVTVGTNNDKSGYSLSQSFPANFASLSITAGGLVDITQAAADKVWGTASRVLTANTNLNIPTAANIRAEIDTNSTQLSAIKSKTDNLPASPAATGDIPTASAIRVEIDSNSTQLSAIKSKTDNLPASPAAVSDIPTTAAIADAIWDEAQSGHTTAGTFGLYLDAKVSEAGGGSLTVQEIVDGVWDETLADHLAAGSTGAGLNAAGSAGDPWSTALPGAYGAGSAGHILGHNLNAAVDSRASQTSVNDIASDATAIKAKTDNLPASPAATGDIPNAAAIRTEIDSNSTQLAAIKSSTDNLPASPAATGDIPTAANIRAEIDTNSNQLTAIKSKTDNLPANPAAVSDVPAASAIRSEMDANSTQLAAIKSKTDALPASPAAVSDIPGAAAIRGEMDANSTRLAAIQGKTDNLPAAPAATGDIPTAAAIRAEIDSNSTQLAETINRLPAALVGGRMDANASAIAGSGQASTYLRDHALRAVPVTFSAGGTTTAAVFDQVDGAAASSQDDVYNGRVLIFSAPANLKDQACTVTDYDGATKTAIISAVTIAVDATASAVLV